jgi:TolB protein
LAAASPQLVFVYGDVGSADVQVFDPATKHTWPVADAACDEAEPDWAPDGRSVVYQADCDGNYDLYLVDIYTRAVRQLTATREEDEREPDVSPDGAWIVYRTNREENARNADGSLQIRRLVGGEPLALGVSGRAPSWSPDGTQVLFMSARDGGWDVYVFTVADNSTRRLTDCAANCRFPAWSADGRWVVYHSTTGPDTADAETIWRVSIGGGEPKLLITGNSAGRPSWSAAGLIAFNSQAGIEVVDEHGQQRRTLLFDNSHWGPAWSR